VKVVGGVVAFVAGVVPSSGPVTPIPSWVHLLNSTVFGATGAWLVFGGRFDPRAFHLGAAFLVIGSSFSDPLVQALPRSSALGGVNPLALVHADAFFAYVFWLFCRDFPRGLTSPAADRLVRWALRVSFALGAGLFLVNVILNLPLSGPGFSEAAGVLAPFSRRARPSYYWTSLFALTLPAPLFALWRGRRAPLEERRRAGLFLGGLTLGVPMMLDVVLETLFPSFKARASTPPARLAVGLMLYPLLLLIPVTTAYSVTVNRVLEVRLIVRKALRYLVARYAVIVVTALPFGAALLYLYRHRDESLVDLVSGYGLASLLAAGATGVLAYRLRRRLVDALDRRFFREEYDSRLIMASLAEKSRSATGAAELSALLQAEIDRALHLESLAAVFHDPPTDSFRSPDGRVRPLDASSALAVLAGGSVDALDVDLENPDSSLRRLPVEERQWLAEGGFRLLVPLIASTGGLVGLLALGEKKSELPFSHTDRLMLRAVAASVALSLETRLFRASPRPESATATGPPSQTFEAELAAECPDCGRLEPPGALRCATCGQDLRRAAVPYVLLGKFRLEKRVGAGTMGIVYRGFDLALRRHVAIKTLPRVSPEFAVRLRREARAMAAVVHPNLAFIYGAETWGGVPMLIFEYLTGGTLAERLKGGPVSLDHAIELGTTLAGVLEKTHAAGILHRDIKPSNIGYTTGGVPKLLDFGLSHILSDSRLHEALANPDSSDRAVLPGDPGVTLSPDLISSMRGKIAGTPLYLSPEAVRQQPPSVSFDLWGVALVLYEALAGVNPFRKGNIAETLECITKEPILDLRRFRPDCPAAVSHFFRDALALDPSRRPSSATDFRRRLERLKSDLQN
jgi:hypothetical protein